jgi:hypothetical protein
MIADQLSAIRARLDAATPGPWEAGTASCCPDMGWVDGPKGAMCPQFTATKVTHSLDANDAEFIAHAPTDLRALLDEVERLTAERDRAVDDCEILVREVHALGAGAVMKSLFNDRQPVAPAGSTPSPAPISDYRKSYAVMFRREEREKLKALAKVERLTAEVERLTDWQVAVADGLGYLNHVEGQGGYEVAEPDKVIGAWMREVERLIDDPLPAAAWVREVERAAFARGAEAMREAAAQLVIREVDGWMQLGLSGDIRDLPIPEDKR